MSKIKKIIYLDHAATTYMDPAVKKAMEPYWITEFGNPSSLYSKGVTAKRGMAQARRMIASLIGAKPEEIIFTAGGTESVNLAIFGTARMNTDKNTTDRHGGGHIITTKIEHHAVSYSTQALEKEGIKTTYLEVDKKGFIFVADLEKAIRPETILISVMYANNEIGTIEPIAQIGKMLKRINTDRVKNGLTRILFHTDACQAGGVCDIDINRLGVDLMTINGSKIYGPKQTGCLYVRAGTNIVPLIYGGGQERGLRSGTENVPGIIGLAKALELAQKKRLKENKRLRGLRDYFIGQIEKIFPLAKLNGPDERGQKIFDENFLRLPNNINFSFAGMDGEAVLLYLDAAGICVSTGSACNSQNFNPSHVLMAIGNTLSQARGALRFTIGKSTTKKDLDYTLGVLKKTMTLLVSKS